MAGIKFEGQSILNFRRGMTDIWKAERIAATNGMDLTQRRLKDALRAQITGAGMGQRLANTVRGVTYPKGAKKSLEPAGVVFTKAPHILDAANRGPLIRGSGGEGYLTIPLPQCPKGQRGRRFISYPDAVKRFGQPQLVRSRNGYLALFPAVSNKAGTGLRKAGKRATKAGTQLWVPFFFLKKQVQLKKRINAEAALAQAGRELSTNIAASWPANGGALE